MPGITCHFTQASSILCPSPNIPHGPTSNLWNAPGSGMRRKLLSIQHLCSFKYQPSTTNQNGPSRSDMTLTFRLMNPNTCVASLPGCSADVSGNRSAPVSTFSTKSHASISILCLRKWQFPPPSPLSKPWGHLWPSFPHWPTYSLSANPVFSYPAAHLTSVLPTPKHSLFSAQTRFFNSAWNWDIWQYNKTHTHPKKGTEMV